MNYYEALEAMWQADLGASETVLLGAYLHRWNHYRRPESLTGDQWQEVIDLARKKISRTTAYTALTVLLEGGWLSCSRKAGKVDRVAFGAALLSGIRTAEESGSPESGPARPESGPARPESGPARPESGLPYYVQGTREDVQDSQDARERVQEGGEGEELDGDPPGYAKWIAVFEAVWDRTLSREEVRQLSRQPCELLEPIAAYYSAPPGDDERRYRRRSFEAVLAHIETEHDRAVVWLRSEAAKPYRPRLEVLEWKDRVRAIPESALPAQWPELWESHMREAPRPWAEIGPKSRETFLACAYSDGLMNRALAAENPTVARYYVRRWMRQTGQCA